MIRKLVNKVLSSEFNRNVLTLISGTVIAQSLPLLLMPVFTRLFSPEQMGLLAFFMSVTIILGNTVNGKLELAIVLPHRDSDAYNLFVLGTILAGLSAVVIFLFVLFLGHPFVSFFNVEPLQNWLFLLPISVLGLATFNLLNYYFTRFKDYKLISLSKVSRSASTILFQILAGIVKFFGGLIIGYVLGHVLSLLPFGWKLTKNPRLRFKVKKVKLIALLKRYKKFPTFYVPATLANRLAYDLINMIIPMLFSRADLGLFSLAMRYMAVPSYFIGLSFSQIFSQIGSEEKRRTGGIKKSFYSILKRLLIIALPIYMAFFLFSVPAFRIVFGQKWVLSGVYAQIISLFMLVRFVVAPLMNSLYILEKQEFIFVSNIILLVLALSSFIVGYALHLSFKSTLVIYSGVMTLSYLIVFIIIWIIVKKHSNT